MLKRLMLNDDIFFTLATKIDKLNKTLVFAKVSTLTFETNQILRIAEKTMLSCTHHVKLYHREPKLVIKHKL